MKRLLPLVFALATFGLAAQDLREEFHQTYPLSPNGRLIVKNVNGSVRVTAWDRNEVQVDAIKRARTQRGLDEAEIVVNAGGDLLDIRTKYPEHNQSRDGASVEYTLSVPRTAVLESVGTVNGTVRIEGAGGPVKAGTVNGNVEVRGATGDLKLSSVNGRVQADFAKMGSGEVSLNTVNGGVEVGMPAGAGAQLSASTVHGSIDSDFDLPVRKVGFGPGSNVQATLGSGGPAMKLKTVNGSISLRKR